MPKISTYSPGESPEAPLPGQNPDRVEASARSFGFGAGLVHFGQGLDNLHEAINVAEQQQEVSDVRANMATLRGTLTAGFEQDAAKAPPGDPTFTDKFMSNVTNQLAQMGGGLQTKAGLRAFQQESAGVTADFLAKSTEFTVHSAGAKAVADWTTMVNQNAGTLFNDPTQATSIFKSIDQNMNDPAGPFAGVPADKKAALELQAKEQLAMAAARGVVRTSPDMAEKLYNKGNLPGQDYLTEAGNAQIVSYIQTAQNAERTKKALALAQQEHAQMMAAEADGNAILKSIVKDPSNPGVTDMILNSRMKWSQKETMLNIAQHTGAGDGHDQNTYGNGFFQVYQDIHAGKITSPDQLYVRVGPQGNLTVAGVDRLTGEIQGKRTPDGQIESQLKDNFVKAMAKQISGTNEMLHLRDPKGDELTQSALAWFLPTYEKAKQEGKFPDTVLLDPANPHSLWSGAMHFKRDPNTMMRDLMSNNPGADIGAPAAAPTYKSAADVSAAYKAGSITRDQAAGILRQNKWAQ